MKNKSIIDDIKHTGWVIRDWISPFYTLGGAIAFAIGMLTLLDKDGNLHLTRYVGAALLVATFLAWALHFYQRHKHKATETKDETTAPTLHVGLLIVSGFFSVGILLSEALLHEHRQQSPSPAAPLPVTTPKMELSAKETSIAPSASEGIALITPAQDTARSDVPATPAPPAIAHSTLPVASTKLTPSPAQTRPKDTSSTLNHENSSGTKNIKTHSTSEKKEKRPAIINAQCIELMNNFSLGGDLSIQQQKSLEECQ